MANVSDRRSLISIAFLVCMSAKVSGFAPAPHAETSTKLYFGDSKGGDYYEKSSGSFVVKEFALYEDLQEIVQLAKQSMPERPDGILTVVKFTSASDPNCRATEAEYERLARANPATVFLRCFQEYDNASLLMGQASVQTWPTYDLFYGGNRVARLEGGSLPELEELLDNYQFQNSDLDLFSEEADNKKRLAWEDGKVQKDSTKTPRTTSRFIPGYDWDKDRGFFDDLGDKFQEDWDTIYGNWVPNVDEDK